MSDEVESLGEAFPREMTRVRALAQVYAQAGPAAGYALAGMNRDLDAAQKALAESDVVAMVRIYKDLKGWGE